MTAWPGLHGSDGGPRRLSRRFSAVGVDIPPHRLRQIAAGDTATAKELVDVNFALAATAFNREQRHAQRGRVRRRWLRVAVVTGAVVVALNLLLCLGLLFFVLTQHALPH